MSQILGLDVIGDVHGHADALEALLRRLGFEPRNGAWRHAGGRQAVFVGDLIDRGPRQLETVAIARGMVEAGTASVAMGNHEFNAIAFAAPDPCRPGQFLRPRENAKLRHHAAFLAAVGGLDSPCHRETIAFLRSLPLWLDFGQLRVVHACWSAAAIRRLAGSVDASGRLTPDGLVAALSEGSPAHAACEILLKGPEMDLPAGLSYRDAQGCERYRTRTRWWDAQAVTLRAACVETALADRLPDDPLPPDSTVALDDGAPVLFGHYWMSGTPRLLAPTRTCLDYSVARGGVLCAYRFDGESELQDSHLVWVR